MNLLDAIAQRHTIRTFDGRPLEGEVLTTLQEKIATINAETGLHIQLINGEENAFAGFQIHYGKWVGVTNYLAFVGPSSPELHELCGYWGEQLVLWAETQGLKTGWLDTQIVEKPAALELREGEELVVTVAIGYSDLVGKNHKIKTVEETSQVTGEAPEWFAAGMEAALLAPTAGNQQVFCICWDGEHLSATTKPGFLEKVDLGIVKYHFELGAGISHDMWQ